jgi:starvation-inducible DNA-binding protein
MLRHINDEAGEAHHESSTRASALRQDSAAYRLADRSGHRALRNNQQAAAMSAMSEHSPAATVRTHTTIAPQREKIMPSKMGNEIERSGSSAPHVDTREPPTSCDLPAEVCKEIAEGLNQLVADNYALYVKTKHFHWHMSGPNFRDFHRLLDGQGEQILSAIDPLAERVRRLGQPTIRSLGEIVSLSSIKDSQNAFNSPAAMLSELLNDNVSCAKAMRTLHERCDDSKDVATASLLEHFIDDAEQRVWCLFEGTLAAESAGH